MTTYAITAQYEHTTPDGYTGSRQIPTFYLDDRVQGIVSEQHAVVIARDILLSCVGSMPEGVERADQPTSDQLDTIVWLVINDLRNTIDLCDRDARRDEILATFDDYTGNEYGE